jgi:hypothetical protein
MREFNKFQTTEVKVGSRNCVCYSSQWTKDFSWNRIANI